jgi:hypothetical protein
LARKLPISRPADLVVHAHPNARGGEVGIEALRPLREHNTAVAEAGVLIFELGGPVGRDRNLDAGADGPAQSPEQSVADVAGIRSAAGRHSGDLGAHKFVIGKRKSACSIQ